MLVQDDQYRSQRRQFHVAIYHSNWKVLTISDQKLARKEARSKGQRAPCDNLYALEETNHL